jgi:hypothetical protein
MDHFAAQANVFAAAILDSLGEGFLDGLEMLELLADFIEALAGKRDDFFARLVRSMCDREHLFNIVETEADGLGGANELQAFERMLRVDAVIRARSGIRLEQAGALVVANGGDGHAGGPRELADRVGLHATIVTQHGLTSRGAATSAANCRGFALKPPFSYISRPEKPWFG